MNLLDLTNPIIKIDQFLVILRPDRNNYCFSNNSGTYKTSFDNALQRRNYDNVVVYSQNITLNREVLDSKKLTNGLYILMIVKLLIIIRNLVKIF